MSAVARTLDVARSQINERRGRTVKPRGPYRKAEDAEFLAPIRAIVDARPTYGYRRVTALLKPSPAGGMPPGGQCKAGAEDHAASWPDAGAPYRPAAWSNV